MQFRRLAPLLITLLGALAFLHPMTKATRVPGSMQPEAARGAGEGDNQDGLGAAGLMLGPSHPAGEKSSPGFPSAKDLVSEFLFSGAGDQATSPGHQPEPAYRIELLIATVPDPVSSRLPYFFDGFAESLESAAEASGYTLDRFALPWLEKGDSGHDNTPSWHQTLYETVPGLILFRDPQDRKLLLLFLVGETPTTGIHKQAMFSALEQMAQFYPWDPKHTRAATRVSSAGEFRAHRHLARDGTVVLGFGGVITFCPG